MIDVVGRPEREAENLLNSLAIEFFKEYSRPQSKFFCLDEGNYFVIGQRETADGRLILTLASKLRREVSSMAYVIGDNCISCGSCASTCPVGAIAEGSDHYQIDPEKCVECGACANECPVQAISAP